MHIFLVEKALFVNNRRLRNIPDVALTPSTKGSFPLTK